MEQKPTIIDVGPKGIKCAYHVMYRKEENGMYSWYIPGFEIYFSSKNEDEGNKRSTIMVQSFFNFWIKKEGFKQFVLQIHKLGFKAPVNHEFTVKQLLNHKQNAPVKFRSKINLSPSQMSSYATRQEEGAVEMAL